MYVEKAAKTIFEQKRGAFYVDEIQKISENASDLV